MTPEILFEDQHVIVLAKPAGLLCQGDKSGDENLVDWLRDYLGRNYVGLIHRLDRNTSGAIIVAKRTKSAQRLTQALQNGKICRVYRALLLGNVEDEQEWVDYAIKDRTRNEVSIVEKQEGAKECRLMIKPIQHFSSQKSGEITLAEFKLETGRSHQIRAQSSHREHPLMGDPKYGDPKREPVKLILRPALHSYSIEFPHPMSEEIISLVCKIPPDFQSVLDSFAPTR